MTTYAIDELPPVRVRVSVAARFAVLPNGDARKQRCTIQTADGLAVVVECEENRCFTRIQYDPSVDLLVYVEAIKRLCGFNRHFVKIVSEAVADWPADPIATLTTLLGFRLDPASAVWEVAYIRW